MIKVVVVAAAVLFASLAFGSEGNPCGNHGNHCCTVDGGDTYNGVSETCNNFCNDTATAISTAVSECYARSKAECEQEQGQEQSQVQEQAQECIAALGDVSNNAVTTCAEAVATATASCGDQLATLQAACNVEVPQCAKWKLLYSHGYLVGRVCKKFAK